MQIKDIKKFLLSLVLFKEDFYKYTENNNKFYEVNFNNEYNNIKNIYNDTLKDKVFDYTFNEYLFLFKEFIINNEFYNVFLIEHEIVFNLDKFIHHNIIIFAE